ncbi:unnamed protein product, partial [Choristocarpus tenellus]
MAVGGAGRVPISAGANVLGQGELTGTDGGRRLLKGNEDSVTETGEGNGHKDVVTASTVSIVSMQHQDNKKDKHQDKEVLDHERGQQLKLDGVEAEEQVNGAGEAGKKREEEERTNDGKRRQGAHWRGDLAWRRSVPEQGQGKGHGPQ